MKMGALNVIGKESDLQWNEILEKFEDKDIYFFYEYFKSTLFLNEGEPLLFFFENSDGKVAYPVIKRKIMNKNGLKLYDITTPYGYGGPLISAVDDEEKLMQQFRESFNEYCQDHSIVSEFVRFHPLLKNHAHLTEEMHVMHIGHTVGIDLQQGEDLLAQMPGKTRNMIRKAEKNGIEVRELDKEKYLEEFISIYYSTMDRKAAADYYYFSMDYFLESFKLLSSNSVLFGAFLEGKMISSTLILINDNFMHYHLSGGLTEYQSLGATNLLLFKIAEWGKERGIQMFHLGGGYSSKKDSLYDFKKSLSNIHPLKYYVGKKIHHPVLYNMLVAEKGIKEDSGFFPLYRS
ncbi:GNAT family N-acetyltransferase [Planococcus sp. N028]|uniref:Lipid II:glycine glycyltransferase n=1 Tax=Planococcus shixiaomingii TaxID=3058393 RepID=A0ABT8N2R9_9BACL|nr:GNAT family N-acetyltransferase [Planococcus sp. N028]MDN7242169.1 GNAT family N-acetyltransferase [Planococcus sp. N028]